MAETALMWRSRSDTHSETRCSLACRFGFGTAAVCRCSVGPAAPQGRRDTLQTDVRVLPTDAARKSVEAKALERMKGERSGEEAGRRMAGHER